MRVLIHVSSNALNGLTVWWMVALVALTALMYG